MEAAHDRTIRGLVRSRVRGRDAMWMFVPHGSLFAAFTVGAVYGIVSWLWSEPPEFIAKWKRGAEGERKTGRVLRRLEPDWRSVHGREARYGDLHHIAVGPGGVFLLDSKNLTGPITLDEKGLTSTYGFSERDSYTHTKLRRPRWARRRRSSRHAFSRRQA